MIERMRHDRFQDGNGRHGPRATGRSRSLALRRDDKADAPFISILFGCLGVTVLASLLLQALGG